LILFIWPSIAFTVFDYIRLYFDKSTSKTFLKIVGRLNGWKLLAYKIKLAAWNRGYTLSALYLQSKNTLLSSRYIIVINTNRYLN
jgi:hypothetical protein